MSPFPTTLLGLVLCLGHMIYMQEGVQPTPSIRAEPGSVIPWGWPVTIVCQGPAGADKFRLENEKVSDYKDQGNISQPESQETEARFHIPAVTEDTAGPYRCLYHLHGTHTWSLRSEPLELKVTGDPGVTRSTPSTHTESVSSAGNTRTRSQGSTNPVMSTTSGQRMSALRTLVLQNGENGSSSAGSGGLETVYIYIIVGVSVACVLCLLLFVLLLVRRQHQKKHGTPHSRGEEQRPQERLSPAVDTTESTPAAGDELLEKNKEMHSPNPAEGDAQEVTYAQLDKRTLTLRGPRAVSPQSPDPTADSSMYAALARR
ncbi:leukocyte-associated immunoglobulin-like receptor 1 isoform X2 [Saccopteryx bilineata]|uniref:leukocyte-associated immunoglobulin-like receptor 1 isoform X2 n=1 Tax=Saccopteryx bilineata TaxID=59482 RepID=UPI00338DEE8E